VCLQVLLSYFLPYCLFCQAASANVEKSRSLTWDQAMKAGDAPLPPAEDDVYADTGSKADIHQLAAAARKHRQLLSDLQQQWNELVRVRPHWECHIAACPLGSVLGMAWHAHLLHQLSLQSPSTRPGVLSCIALKKPQCWYD
jgi:hypothetical protein